MWVRIAGTTLALALALDAAATVRAQEPAAGPCVPGEVATLTLNAPPARMRSGDRFCFEPRADDAVGCPIPEPRVRYRVDPPVEGAVGMVGRCFLAPALPEGEMTAYRIVAQAGSARRSFSVLVVPLGLEPETPHPPSAAPTPAAPVTAGPAHPVPAAHVEHATSAVAEDARLPAALALAVAVLACALAATLAIAWFSRRRAAAAEGRPVPSFDVPLGRGPDRPAPVERPLECPRCGTRYPIGLAFCSRDGERLR